MTVHVRTWPGAVAQASRRDLRVLLVAHRFPPDAVGGVERYTEQLATRLARAGDVVHVLARSPGAGPLRREVERRDSGVIVHRLAGGKVRRDRFLADREALETLFRATLAEADPDVVHINHVLDLSPSYLALAAQRGAAVVLTLHDYYFACPRIVLRTPQEEPCDGPRGGQECARTCFSSEGAARAQRWALRATYFRRLMRLADQVVCPSPYTAEFFARFGADTDHLEVVSNGIWIDREEPLGFAVGSSLARRRGPLRLGFLGAALPHKGLNVLLDALEEARLEEVELVTFGPVDDHLYARALYAQADRIAGLRFRMFGTYEPDELPPLLAGIDCVVVPSQWPETYCLVAREALACGVPVVAARSGALADDVIDGHNGFVFRPDRTDELAGILRRLDREDDLLPRLRSGALATELPTLDEHVTALRDSYGRALRRARRNGRVRRTELDELVTLQSTLDTCGFGSTDAGAGSAAHLPLPLNVPPTPTGNEQS